MLLSKPQDIAHLIERAHDTMGVATGSIALHLLARSSMQLPAEERKAILTRDWFGKLMMRLGGQLAGASETDAQGLICILWALAALEQGESPLLTGLVKRVLLLVQHGRVSTSQLLLIAQALARLRLLGGPIGLALSNLVQSRLVRTRRPRSRHGAPAMEPPPWRPPMETPPWRPPMDSPPPLGCRLALFPRLCLSCCRCSSRRRPRMMDTPMDPPIDPRDGPPMDPPYGTPLTAHLDVAPE